MRFALTMFLNRVVARTSQAPRFGRMARDWLSRRSLLTCEKSNIQEVPIGISAAELRVETRTTLGMRHRAGLRMPTRVQVSGGAAIGALRAGGKAEIDPLRDGPPGGDRRSWAKGV